MKLLMARSICCTCRNVVVVVVGSCLVERCVHALDSVRIRPAAVEEQLRRVERCCRVLERVSCLQQSFLMPSLIF